MVDFNYYNDIPTEFDAYICIVPRAALSLSIIKLNQLLIYFYFFNTNYIYILILNDFNQNKFL